MSILQTTELKKYYGAEPNITRALDGVTLSIEKGEFVAIVGTSGSGKSTLLNMIGGLDVPTSGQVVVDGKELSKLKDEELTVFRRRKIGFIFQNYNLVPVLNVFENIVLPVELDGNKVDKKFMNEVVQMLGLEDKLNNMPNNLSGGQQQRVAIARALVSKPAIVLADEPTGALDSETSVQVMDLLAEIAKEKLVIMVTHNPELAERYATRTIRLLDGQVVDDSSPFDGTPEKPVRLEVGKKKPSMSFFTAFSLSLNNLMTKKGRTILTSFAGSIGIIGIALILSLSSGINSYINQIQEETLSSYPITIQAESTDMSDLMSSLMGARRDGSGEDHDRERVYSSTVMYDMLNSMIDAEVQTNNLKDFKKYLDQGGGGITDLATVQYGYDFNFDIYTEDEDGEIVKSDVMTLLQTAMSTMYGGDYSSYFATMGSMYERMDVWEELLPGNDGSAVGEQVKSQYDLLYGSWPESYDEVILFVDRNNEISDLMLYALGLLSSSSMTDSLNAAMEGETLEAEVRSWSYEELCGMDFKLLLPAEKYQYEASTDTWVDMSATDTGMDFLYNSEDVGVRLKVVGVARPNEESTNGMVTGAIGYTGALTTYAIEATAEIDIVKEQMADKETDVINGLPFPREDDEEPTGDQKRIAIKDYLLTLPDTEKAAAYMDVMSQPSGEYVENVVAQQMEGMTRQSIEQMIIQQYAGEMGVDEKTVAGYIADMDDETLFARVEEAIAGQVREQYAQGVQAQLGAMSQEQLALTMQAALEYPSPLSVYAEPFEAWQYAYLYDSYMPPTKSGSTYEDNLEALGYVDLESPSTISIYASTFSEKDQIAGRIADYNASVTNSEDEINYTDYVALLMSSITDIISGISYLLIAFVSISLIVSSIMIGIITYISVLERTKEIGILRAVGASKRDVGRVFNAETLIVGLGAGIIGIGVTLLLIIPINAILLHFTGIAGLKAALPIQGAVILVAISALLTIISGLIPSRVAARKDPVVALRTE